MGGCQRPHFREGFYGFEVLGIPHFMILFLFLEAYVILVGDISVLVVYFILCEILGLSFILF